MTNPLATTKKRTTDRILVGGIVLFLLSAGAPLGAADHEDALATPVLQALDEVVCPVAQVSFASACPEWRTRYDGSDTDTASRIAMDPAGERTFVTGGSIGDGTGSDIITVAYDVADGTELWAVRYDGPLGLNDRGTDVVVGPSGDVVYVVGYSQGDSTGANVYEMMLLAYDTATGASLWETRQKLDGPSHDIAVKVAVTPDGSRLVVGGWGPSATEWNGPSDHFVYGIDAADGTIDWTTRHGGPDGTGTQIFSSLALSPDGARVHATGWSRSEGASVWDRSYMTYTLDTATGDMIWSIAYHGDVAEGQDEASAIAVSPDGAVVFVTGTSAVQDGRTFATIAYSSATGDELWMTRYTGPQPLDQATAIVVDPAGGRVFVSGYSWGFGSHLDYATVAYDSATGDTLWSERYDGPHSHEDRPWGMAIAPDGGRVYVTGQARGAATGSGIVTIAYDTDDGHADWTAIEAGGSWGEGRSIAVGPEAGAIVVVGHNRDPVDHIYDLVTMRYLDPVEVTA